MSKLPVNKRNKDVGVAGNGGQWAATAHAAPTIELKPATSSKGVTTTVTLPDGTVATRSSVKGNYTHAVVLSPEVPERVLARAEAQIRNATEEIERIDAALENPKVRIRDRRISGNDDPDIGYDGKPRYSGFEVTLNSPDGKGEPVARSWSNSKGVVGSTGTWDEENQKFDFDGGTPQKAHAHLKAAALSNRNQQQGYLEAAQETIAAVQGGIYDFGGYSVARWSSRAELAEKAARSEFPVTGYARDASVVAVD